MRACRRACPPDANVLAAAVLARLCHTQAQLHAVWVHGRIAVLKAGAPCREGVLVDSEQPVEGQSHGAPEHGAVVRARHGGLQVVLYASQIVQSCGPRRQLLKGGLRWLCRHCVGSWAASPEASTT